MSTNRYAPPKSEVADLDNGRSVPVPEETLKKIKHAWTAGLISAAMTLVITLLAVLGVKIMAFDAWEFLDVALILGLTYGIYRKSRVCAVLMIVYFLISKIIMFAESGKANGIILTIVFLYYYGQGVVGTFAYHKHRQRVAADNQVVS